MSSLSALLAASADNAPSLAILHCHPPPPSFASPCDTLISITCPSSNPSLSSLACSAIPFNDFIDTSAKFSNTSLYSSITFPTASITTFSASPTTMSSIPNATALIPSLMSIVCQEHSANTPSLRKEKWKVTELPSKLEKGVNPPYHQLDESGRLSYAASLRPSQASQQ
ncbi:hypothetical protein E4T56_gene18964 [Termitomyces sp. T112]|nr:hypothetical protein E4T56_gene18964 [Termitomyces sp. T112]